MGAGTTRAARRTPRGSSSSPTFGGSARRGRELPHTKKSAHRAARRLDPARDPDTIDDEQVRDAFLEQRMQDLDDEESGKSGRGRRLRESATDAASESARRSSLSLGRRATGTADDAGGVFLGMIGAALVINYLRAGWPGVTAWARAKFLNETSSINDAGQVTPTTGGAGGGKGAAKKQPSNPLSPGSILHDVENSPLGVTLNPVGTVAGWLS